MDFMQWLQITGTVVAIAVGLVAIWNSGRTKNNIGKDIDLLQNNHLSTLKTRIDELERQKTAMWEKQDLMFKMINDLNLKIEKLDQYVKLRLNGIK